MKEKYILFHRDRDESQIKVNRQDLNLMSYSAWYDNLLLLLNNEALLQKVIGD